MIDIHSNERDYRKANYRIKNEDLKTYKIYKDEYFVTAVLEKHYEIDKTIYIGTAGSMWDKLYVHYCEKNKITIDEEYKKELRSITEKVNKNTEVNLKLFYDLMKWIKGENAFKEYGNSYEFLDIRAEKQHRRIFKFYEHELHREYKGEY